MKILKQIESAKSIYEVKKIIEDNGLEYDVTDIEFNNDTQSFSYWICFFYYKGLGLFCGYDITTDRDGMIQEIKRFDWLPNGKEAMAGIFNSM